MQPRNHALSQTCEESTEVISGFHDSLVSRDVGHRAERVKDLGPRDTGHALHTKDVHLALGERVHELLVSSGVDEGEERVALSELRHLLHQWGIHLQNEVRLEHVRLGLEGKKAFRFRDVSEVY